MVINKDGQRLGRVKTDDPNWRTGDIFVLNDHFWRYEMPSNAEQGVAIRRMVLGDEYVEKAYNDATDFSRDLQDFLAEHCWGGVWVRGDLDVKYRSMITLTALACGGHWTEFRAHVRGAFRNGITATELREALLHLAVYAGVPTAVEAFRTANDVVREYCVDGANSG